MRADAIVEVLARGAGNELDHLRKKYPDEQDLLHPTVKMGGQVPKAKRVAVYRDLGTAGLKEARRSATAILAALPARAQRAKSMKLWSSIIAAVTSAGVVSSALVGAREATVISAVISFLATAIGLVAAYVETPLFGEGGLADLVNECLTIEHEGSGLQIVFARPDATEDELAQAVAKVNELCAKLRRISIFGGVGPANRLPATT